VNETGCKTIGAWRDRRCAALENPGAKSDGKDRRSGLSDALPPWLPDALCRLASGGGFAVRQLYTDQDEVLIDAARPLILNGIEDVVTRPDLADRGLFVTLPWISDAQRRPEKELWREFELARPRILGALLNAANRGLGALPRVRLDRLPRMADLALWATACETALWPGGTFSLAYAANRRAAIDNAIDADPWPPACARSWPSAAPGPAALPIFCATVAIPSVTPVRRAARAGPATLVHSPAACVALRPSCGRSALT
jgi:hypothetical protein